MPETLHLSKVGDRQHKKAPSMQQLNLVATCCRQNNPGWQVHQPGSCSCREQHLKCLPPSCSMKAVRPLLVTESVTMVVPGYFLHS